MRRFILVDAFAAEELVSTIDPAGIIHEAA